MSDNYSSTVCAEEADFIRKWAELLDGKKGIPVSDRYNDTAPFSFLCGKWNSRDWLSLEDARRKSGEWRDGKRMSILTWTGKETSVRCEMELTEFSDFPVLEWVLKLTNCGDKATEPISNFKALDIVWKRQDSDKTTPELRRSLGSDGRYDDFQYLRDELRQSMWDAPRTVRMDSATNAAFRKARNGSPSFLLADGRTSATWLPFFNLHTGDDGIICALGWSGQWFAELAHDGNGKTDISAGMEHLELKLNPGEEIRSPRVMLLYWHGTPTHSHNMLRQFILKYHRPTVNGRPAEMPVCNGSWGGTPTPGHLDVIGRIAKHGLSYDYYWIDAGWYGTSTKPCPDVFHGEWGITGNWCVNRNYHPEGLKPISAAAHRAGMKFLLWLEPERALHGTPVTLEHPEWFLRRNNEELKPGDNLLLNLGNPEAWAWVVETVSSLISENGIDCYREDFNIDPSPFWAFSDEAGRKGLVEMRFVEGLYSFWDELRRRHPGLLIDNCASGGRRLDLETIGRSVALWRTDYSSALNADALQLHSAGLNLWLPLNATSPNATPGDTYQVRSAFSAGLVLNVEEFGMGDCTAPDFPWNWFKKMIGEAKRLRPYFLGDFHPLTPCVIDPEAWMAYQLLVPGKQEGAVLAFRRAESPMSTASFQLRGLDLADTYELEDADTGGKFQETGLNMINTGLRIDIPGPRGCRLLFYHTKK